jgi:hypothetical protein
MWVWPPIRLGGRHQSAGWGALVRVEKGGSSDGVEWEMVADSTLIHGLIFADACCFGYNVMLMTILPLTVMEIYSRFTAWNWFHEAVRPSIHVLLRWLLLRYLARHLRYDSYFGFTAVVQSLPFFTSNRFSTLFSFFVNSVPLITHVPQV